MADLEKLTLICEQTRKDFLHGYVSEGEILDAAAYYGVTNWFKSVQTGRLLPLTYNTFPYDCCSVSTVVVRMRAEDAGALSANAKFIEGGYFVSKHPSSNLYHAFIDTGEVGWRKRRIITDVTADQFKTAAPEVYVGPLIRPWATVTGYCLGMVIAKELLEVGNA